MAKVKLPKIIKIDYGQITLTHVGGWTLSGAIACTYDRVLEEGTLEVISPRHVYHWMAGRDLYPTPEQMIALLAGEKVTFNTQQWA